MEVSPREEGAAPPWIPRALMTAGLVLALASLAGDLALHARHPGREAAEAALAGQRPALWHVGLFAGLVAAGAGAAVLLGRTGGRTGRAAGVVLGVLAVGTVAAGVWSVVAERAGPPSPAQRAAHAPADARPRDPSRPGASVGVHGTGAGGGGGAAGLSTAQARTVARQLAAARRGTARYRDAARARSDGYVQVTQFLPGLGLHMADPGALARPFDPARPPILLYEPSRSGRLVLVGVAYAVRGRSAPSGFAGGADEWHVHHDLCFLPGGSVRSGADAGACAADGGLFQRRTPWLLHAWIWKRNPLGVFVERNPLV